MEKSLINLFSNTTPVILVANENVEGRPILTPMLNPDQSPKTDLNGAPLGSIRLQQMTRSVNGGSFMNVRNRVAFIGGTMEQLEALIKENNLVEGIKLPGKIKVTESLEPFWKNQTSKINPQTGEQVGIQVGDTFYPVYLRMVYTEDITAPDKFIRSAEDVNEWLSARKTLVSTASQTPVETAAMPQA
jgi:hypothetical protein